MGDNNVGLEGDRFCGDLLLDEAVQLLHHITFDLLQQPVEVALVRVGETVCVGRDLLREGLRLLREVAF
jgi:hypothetical protein